MRRTGDQAIKNDDANSQVTLTLEGASAQRGVALRDFEVFIENFLRALRDFDRDRRSEPTRKAGHPERRAEAATAFRLVRFAPGSGVATLEPETGEADTDAFPLDETPLALDNLRLLASSLADGADIPDEVVDDLEKARRAFGDDGSISIRLPESVMATEVTIDKARLEEARKPREPTENAVTAISGRLHLVDLEPDRLAIRTSAGVEWSCRYDEELEPTVTRLIGQIVRAEGLGALSTPLRGSMQVYEIRPVIESEQSELFTSEVLADVELLDRQGLVGPQGIDALADAEWSDDEADKAYIDAIFGE